MLGEQRDDLRIERSTRHFLQQPQRVFPLHSLPIGTIAPRGIVKINHRNYAGDEWDPLCAQAFGISAAIPLFVVKSYDVFDRIRKIYSLQDVTTNGRMDLHLREFCFSKLAGFVQDVFRHCEFADVVQQRAGDQRTQFRLGNLK